jgi:hypothetical protein
MTGAFLVLIALTLSDPPPPPTGVPECDRYVAMVSACLPKMCEEERMLREMELGFAVETIAAVVKEKGKAAAAESCTRDVTAELREDLYACHADSPSASTRVELTPAGDSLVLRFSSPALAGAETADVAFAEPLAEPVGVYRVTSAQGTFVLDTRTASPLGSTTGAVTLEADTPYCYTIATSADDAARRRILRKGVASTRGKP